VEQPGSVCGDADAYGTGSSIMPQKEPGCTGTAESQAAWWVGDRRDAAQGPAERVREDLGRRNRCSMPLTR
jgi:hypothetical protein